MATAGDAVARFADTLGTLDHGLHGGTSRALDNGRAFALRGDVLVPGVPVSGNIQVSATMVSAKLTVRIAGQATATFAVRWAVGGASGALAEVTGTSHGQAIVGSTYAP